MRSVTVWISLLTLFLIMGVIPAQAKDITGSKDHPLLKRYEGSDIVKYSQNAYDSYSIPIEPSKNSTTLREVMNIEGAVTRLTYVVPVGRSSLEVVRNYENELKNQGFEVVFKGSKKDLGSGFAEAAGYKQLELPPNIPAFILNEDSQHFLAMKKGTPESGDVYAVIFGVEQKFWASDLKNVQKGQAMVQVDVIETKPMEKKMVTVTADEMAGQIASSGRVALYGIFFDFNKADIKAESKPTLDEMAKFLKSSNEGNFLVVGHTDSVGGFESNINLSQRRAEAVVKALVSIYGVPQGKLKPVGIAYASPMATNRTEEGRAKNRRVELVEY